MLLSTIEDFLNRITMYRLVFYGLIFLWLAGFVLSFFNAMPFSPVGLIMSSAIIFISCITINIIFEKILKAPTNPESTYITSLILSLTMGPENSWNGFVLLILASLIAISSKYLLAIHKKNIFNPAAIAMVVLSFTLNYYPSWWIGDIFMYPFVIVIGLLITKKIQRFDLVLSFYIVFILTSLGRVASFYNIFPSIVNLFAYSPILFFSFIMLTEPSTTPPKRILRIAYGSLVAFLISPFFHIGRLYFSPELALLAGNVFSFIVSPKEKLLLTLRNKIAIAQNAYDFVFNSDRKFRYKPGQYMEWTLPHSGRDDRGARRYFTLASSPTEDTVSIGVKFYEKPSSFKKKLSTLEQGDKIFASQLAGEFTMPEDKKIKLAFIAGGIGITPFRSMIKYLLDTNERRDIILFYAANSYNDICYKEIFDEAEEKLGIKTIYVLKDLSNVTTGLKHEIGIINQSTIEKYTPDFKERRFYISGQRSMITAFEKMLSGMHIKKNRIKTDFFPGYA